MIFENIVKFSSTPIFLDIATVSHVISNVRIWSNNEDVYMCYIAN